MLLTTFVKASLPVEIDSLEYLEFSFAVLGTVGLFIEVRFGERNIYLIANTIKDFIHAGNSNYINKYLTVHVLKYFI